MDITVKYLSNRPKSKLFTLRGLVIHSTANPNVGCDNHYSYFNRVGLGTHYIVDNKKCLQLAPTNELMYHVGANANPYFIGIEICEMYNDFNTTWNNAVDVVKKIVKAHNIKKENVVTHDWISRNYGGTDHTDPVGFFKKHGRTFDQFLNEVFKKEEVRYKMENMVCYCNETDKKIAELLSEHLGCPCMNATINFNYNGVAKNLIAVGGDSKPIGFSSYTTKHIKGKDRWETIKEVLKFIGKL